MRKLILLILFFVHYLLVYGQSIRTLDGYLAEVLSKGYGVQTAKTNWSLAALNFNIFESQMKPQISFQANLPRYSKTSSSIVQPNGSISFQPIYQHSASFSLVATQPLILTGGTLFIESSLDRFDDLSRDIKIFNGIPVRLGYSQSLIGYNVWKWNKKIEQLKISNARRLFNFDIENSLFQAVNTYFDVLIAATNQLIAESNKTVNEKLLVIAQERLDLGKISKDEKLQIEAEYKQATIFLTQSNLQLSQSKARLENLLQSTIEIQYLNTPEIFTTVQLDDDYFVRLALNQAPTLLENQLALLTLQNDMARTKAELSPTFQIYASMGLAQSGNRANEIYNMPFTEQQVQVGINVPILDWGRKKSSIKSTNERISIAELEKERQTKEIETMIRNRCQDIVELQNRIAILKDIVQISEERYMISKERYAVGTIPLTELIFAQRYKDQTLRDYLLGIRDFYITYYDLRRWTGFDIKTNQNITY